MRLVKVLRRVRLLVLDARIAFSARRAVRVKARNARLVNRKKALLAFYEAVE